MNELDLLDLLPQGKDKEADRKGKTMTNMIETVRENKMVVAMVMLAVVAVVVIVVLWMNGIIVDDNSSSLADPSNPVGITLRQVTRF